jgi:ribosomal protein S18 acetylase RimI-like enzyme
MREKLTEKEINDARGFTRFMSSENGMVYKLDVYTLTQKPNSGAAHILYYEDGSVAGYTSVPSGYAYLNGYREDETEVTFIGKTEAAFNAMFDTLMESAPSLPESGKAKKLLAIANRDDKKLIEWLKDRGFVFFNTEYRLALRPRTEGSMPSPRPLRDGFTLSRLRVKTATTEDTEAVLELDKLFGAMENAGEILPEYLSATKIAFLDGEPAGKMRIDGEAGVSAIYGFVMKPKYRGKGLGREFLSEVIEDLSSKDFDKIYLEAASDNTSALKLYESLGFRTEAVFDYYKLEVLNT